MTSPKREWDQEGATAPLSPHGPLAGVRVIELGQLLAGPFAGRLFAEMGAEVIKVEAPGHPDPLRQWGQARYKGRSLWWPVQSRNKKCITLNLREKRGQELCLDLVRQSDVVVENFRPGTLERWNLGYEQLSAVNRGVILCRISGYGQTGPYAGRAGYASVAEAMGGLRHISGFPGEAPPRMNISLGDSLAGMFAAYGVLAALHWREGSGQGAGQEIDVSLVEACFALLESAVPDYDLLGFVREPHGTTLKDVAPSNIFQSRDGKWVVIAANQDSVFRRLAAAIDRPELAEDDRYATHTARSENQEELDRIIADWADRLPAARISELLNDVGVVCGPVYTIADIFEDPQFAAREMLVPHDDPELGEFIGPGIVPKLSQTPGEVKWTGPAREGEHNEAVYGELLGLPTAERDELGKQGIL